MKSTHCMMIVNGAIKNLEGARLKKVSPGEAEIELSGATKALVVDAIEKQAIIYYMESLKFKTNIKCSACVAKVTTPLNETVGEGKWSVDLTHPGRTLTIEGNINETKMREALEKVGYKAERLND